jgi:hypothetical protein
VHRSLEAVGSLDVCGGVRAERRERILSFDPPLED